MRVRDVMVRDVAVVKPETSFREAVAELARRMVHAGARRAIVVDGEMRAVGVVSPLELARADAVGRASEESFPASDAPSWMGATAG